MHGIPRLIINLCEKVPNGFVALGLYDLTAPASDAMANGRFEDWHAGYIPATTKVCMHLDHMARMAAWNGRLYSYDLADIARTFEASVDRFGGPGRLLEYMRVKYAAQGVRRNAETLYGRLANAEFVEGSRLSWMSHPITGEIRPGGPFVAEDGVPFAFAGLDAAWKGVDARELFDFTKENGGQPDALEFLAATFDDPYEAVVDVEGLDDAVEDLRDNRNAGRFRRWVEEWNSRQDVRLTFSDERRATGLDKTAALEWCARYVISARNLEKSVEELYSNPSR